MLMFVWEVSYRIKFVWGGAPGWFSLVWLWCGGRTHRGGSMPRVYTERSDRPWVTLNLCVIRLYSLQGKGTWYPQWAALETSRRVSFRRCIARLLDSPRFRYNSAWKPLRGRFLSFVVIPCGGTQSAEKLQVHPLHAAVHRVGPQVVSTSIYSIGVPSPSIETYSRAHSIRPFGGPFGRAVRSS